MIDEDVDINDFIDEPVKIKRNGKNMLDVRDLIGKPFDINGKGNPGWNCYNLSCEVCKRAGIIIPSRQPIIDLSERSESISQGLSEYFIRVEKPEPFCLVTFIIIPPFVSHIGTVLEDCNSFIHIMLKRCVVIEKLNSLNWIRKIEGYYKYVGTTSNS